MARLMPCTLVTDAEFKLSSVFVGNTYEVGLGHSVNDAGVVVNYIRPLMLLYFIIVLHTSYASYRRNCVLIRIIFFLLSGWPGLRIDSLQVSPKFGWAKSEFS